MLKNLISFTTLCSASLFAALPAVAEHHTGTGYSTHGGGYSYGPRYAPPRFAPFPGGYGWGGMMPQPPFGGAYAPMMPPMPGYMPPQPGATAPASQAAAPKPAPNTPAAENAAVTIDQMRFEPPRITVQKGTTVTWQQADRMPHTVTASDGSFGSGTLNAGGSFSQTFDTAGTYGYYCALHPSMRGEVVVVD